ncbi:MAG: carbohydrate ABC transporter permease [Firmicutes bacterium]|nr:carbohydrate ABC transporter permease [Bacillota bacterium]
MSSGQTIVVEKQPKKIFFSEKVQHTLQHIFLIAFAIVIFAPFFYLFASSLKNMGQFFETDLRVVWFPWPLHWENYVKAVTQINLFLYIRNSVILAVLQTSLTLLSSVFIAYGFARFDFKGNNLMFTILLATMMLPTQVTNIPLFLFYRKLGWMNTFLPLLIPYLFGNAYFIFLLRQFMITLPKELDEAAFIDGCNSFSILTKVIVPQCIPVMVVVALFAFLGSWKDFWNPLIYLSNARLYTLPIGLLFFESPTNFEYTTQLAAVVIALIPTAIFYILGQKYLDRGINIAEVK